ncbi:MAG TPA: hypothetical protein VMD04_00340 [Candidatus Margulisiibacteriota bacterium]|nr:hypothetical protein [Candidatus Margulisiibacteriota bacterium]
MKKITISILTLIVGAAVVLLAARNIIVKEAIKKGIEEAAGIKVEIKNMDIGIFKPAVEMRSLRIYNPANFTDRLMADIPQIYVDYDLAGFFKNKVHLKELKIDIKELSAVLDKNGKLNFNSLALIAPKPGGGKPPEIKIDELTLKIGKIAYKGYLPALGGTGGEVNLNMEETFHDVTDPSKLTRDILNRILSRIGISDFAKLDIPGQATQIKEKVMEGLSSGVEGVTSTAKALESNVKDELTKTSLDLKKLFK